MLKYLQAISNNSTSEAIQVISIVSYQSINPIQESEIEIYHCLNLTKRQKAMTNILDNVIRLLHN